MSDLPPSRLYRVNLHGQTFRLHLSGAATQDLGFARDLDDFLSGCMHPEDALRKLPDFLAAYEVVLSDVLDLAPKYRPLPLQEYVERILRDRDPQRAALLLVMAFEDADEDAQVQLLQRDPVRLQWGVRALLEQLDEHRDDTISALRRVLAPPLQYLILT